MEKRKAAAGALGLGLLVGINAGTITEAAGQSGLVKPVAYADKILLHMHPEKVLNYLPDLGDAQIAYLFGMPEADYRRVKQVYDDEAKEAAVKLLADRAFAEKVKRLPFRKNEKVMVLGESTTDALNSWAVILQHLLQLERPGDSIRVINWGISGQTTAEALKRITMQVKQQPGWMLCFLGSNDCYRYNGPGSKTNVSLAETLGNLRTIRDVVTAGPAGTRFIWLAPAPVDEERAAAFPPFRNINLTVTNADLLAIGDSLKTEPEQVIDFREVLGVPAQPVYMQFDGSHYTIEGQMALVKHIVNNIVK